MKKILLTLSMAITMSSAWAAKAINKPITIQQSDGTLITVYLHGDEDFHWYTSADGTILLRNGNDFTPITETPETFFAKAENARRMNVMKREPVTGSSKALFPHTGSPKALVILAQYQDVAFSLADPKKSFDQYLNKAEGETLGAYLDQKVFAGMKSVTLEPDPVDVEGFNKFMERYIAALPVERAAVDSMK